MDKKPVVWSYSPMALWSWSWQGADVWNICSDDSKGTGEGGLYFYIIRSIISLIQSLILTTFELRSSKFYCGGLVATSQNIIQPG